MQRLCQNRWLTFNNIKLKLFLLNTTNMNLEKLPRLQKVILGILSTIFLGAIGSGLWEIGISPLYKNITTNLVMFLSSISQNYENSIYIRVGDGNKDIITHEFFRIMYGILFWIPLFLAYVYYRIAIRNKLNTSIEKNNDSLVNKSLNNLSKKKKLLFYVFILPFCIWNSFSVFSNTITTSYTHNKIIYIEQSIDIIAPFIPNQELLKLKSEYRQIKSKITFDEFNLKLRALAKQNGVNLRTDY